MPVFYVTYDCLLANEQGLDRVAFYTGFVIQPNNHYAMVFMIKDGTKTNEIDGKIILKQQINNFIESANLIVEQLDSSMDLEKLNSQFRTLCFFYKMALELKLNFIVKTLSERLLPSAYTDIVPGLDSLWRACQELMMMTLSTNIVQDDITKVGQYIVEIDTYCDVLGLENPTNTDDMIQFTFVQAKTDMLALQQQMTTCFNRLDEWESMILALTAGSDQKRAQNL